MTEGCTPTKGRYRATEFQILFVIALSYFVGAWWGDRILIEVGMPTLRTAYDVSYFGALSVVRQMLPFGPSVFLAVVGARRFSWRARLGQCRIHGYRTLVVSLLVSALASWILDHWGIWPWHWRLDLQSNLLFVGSLLSGKQYAALVMWALSIGVMLPVLEELIFRFGILQYIRHKTGSTKVAVMLSAGLFSVAHLGPGVPLSADNIRNALGALGFGLIVGYIAGSGGSPSLRAAAGAHIGRSLLEVCTLISVAPRIHILG
jgi:hypothetical protein